MQQTHAHHLGPGRRHTSAATLYMQGCCVSGAVSQPRLPPTNVHLGQRLVTLPILGCVQQCPVRKLGCRLVEQLYCEPLPAHYVAARATRLMQYLDAHRQSDHCDAWKQSDGSRTSNTCSRVGLRCGFATPAKQSGLRWSLKRSNVLSVWDANHIAKHSTRAQANHFTSRVPRSPYRPAKSLYWPRGLAVNTGAAAEGACPQSEPEHLRLQLDRCASKI